MKILIAYDGSSCADAALEDLQRAGLPREAEAMVLAVAELWLPPPPISSYEMVGGALPGRFAASAGEPIHQQSRVAEDAHSLAYQASGQIQSLFPGWKVDAQSCCGSPAHEILKKSHDWNADLIVVGSHGRSALGRLIMGSVSQRVVTEARCSVRVARDLKPESDSPIRILIGIDGSPHAEAAVRAVAAREWPAGAEARLLTSTDPYYTYVFEREDNYAFVKNIQRVAEVILQATGLQVSCAIKEAIPKQALIEEAEQWGASSIFVGAHGRSRLGRLLLGSVSTAVVARAHCSVEVARVRDSLY
jgi:nucleotide-binding universal stress UspA family protein